MSQENYFLQKYGKEIVENYKLNLTNRIRNFVKAHTDYYDSNRCVSVKMLNECANECKTDVYYVMQFNKFGYVKKLDLPMVNY